MADSQILPVLLRLYRPNVRGGPNFAPANAGRGYNRALLDVGEALGESRGFLEAEFRLLDAEAYERTEKAIAKIEAEERADGR